MAGRRWLAAVLALVALTASCASQQGVRPVSNTLPQKTFPTRQGPSNAVLTQRGDTTRLGWYADERKLSVATVSSGHFGKRDSYPVDGKVYAQPLYVPGGQRAIVVVATEHGSVYAFDAHGHGTDPVWKTSLLQPGARPFLAATDRIATNRLCDSITPEVSVTSTPVIDWTSKTIYVMALDVEHGTMTYRLHALDLATGKEKRPSTVVSAQVEGKGMDAVNGEVKFTASDEQQRMGLALVDGVVYMGFASWCGLAPYHGWLLGFHTNDVSPAVVYNSSPDDHASGLWESQAGVTADEHGNLLLVTGNGSVNLDSGGHDAGDTLLRMVPDNGTLRALDTFTPFDQECRARHDQDLGSGSPLVVPGHDELVLSSKTGSVYVLDRSHLVYGNGSGAKLTEWKLGPDGKIVPTPVAQAPEEFGYPGAIPVVSSDATLAGTGIVWTIDGGDSVTLRAFDAADISHEIWNSDLDKARDGLDDHAGLNHFTAATVADGQVFVGDQSHLQVFGPLTP